MNWIFASLSNFQRYMREFLLSFKIFARPTMMNGRTDKQSAMQYCSYWIAAVYCCDCDDDNVDASYHYLHLCVNRGVEMLGIYKFFEVIRCTLSEKSFLNECGLRCKCIVMHTNTFYILSRIIKHKHYSSTFKERMKGNFFHVWNWCCK